MSLDRTSLYRPDDADDFEEDFLTFRTRLVHHSQWKSERIFLCGSMGDIPLYRQIVNKFKFDKKDLDFDVMMYPTSQYAANRTSLFPEMYIGDIIKIYTEDVHTGYARLIREKDNRELSFSDLHLLSDVEKRHGPAMEGNNKTIIIDNKYSLRNDEMDKAEGAELDFEKRDNVYAVHSPYWPVDAIEWITRRLDHEFPAKSVIKEVVRYGCDFVQVSHNRLYNNGEWRFSFSRAEFLIAQSWTMSQRIVYSTLWVINKTKIKSSHICTYYFKTMMFWACEKKHSDFWSDDMLVSAVGKLLNEMKECVESKFCANYFIRGNNMMDHLIDTDLSQEITILQSCQSYHLISRIVDNCRLKELESAQNLSNVDIEMPDWIKRAFLLHRRLDNDDDNYADLFSTEFKTDLEVALRVELSDIYRGLIAQKLSVDDENVDDQPAKDLFLRKSESHFLLAVGHCESQERDTIENISNKLAYKLVNDFVCVTDINSTEIEISVNKMRDSVCDYNEVIFDDMEKVYERRNCYKHLIESKIDGRRISIMATVTRYKLSVDESNAGCYSEWCGPSMFEQPDKSGTTSASMDLFYNEWPGWSPTVHLSWFIAKAYLANLYYTTQRDVSLAIKTCDDIIDGYMQSKKNHQFAERTFPVLLSTQWASIYDKEIQELLGFYSLCSYELDPSSSSVYLGVCPVQFALYLKQRLVKTDDDT